MKKTELAPQTTDAVRWLKHYKTPIAIIAVLLVIVVALMAALRSSHKLQNEMQERLDYQNDLIATLQNRPAHEEDSIFQDTVPVVTSEQLEEQLVAVQELVTQKYFYRNADKRESSQTWIFNWERPFSGKSILITYDGVIKAGIDLSQVQIDVDEDTRTISVVLPSSVVTDNNIPQETIDVVEVKNGLFNDVTFDDYNDFISEQKIVMEQRAIDQGLLTSADQEARALIKSFLSLVPGVDTYKLIIK